ncbi:transglycosylase domain-containing protein [Allonocardiopsis opalescens]|uniref:Membrane peptidoglycan carboxypeptidase n=1 Tax=Allonocardiopsis opalescens TaxID=1144618 RepID=A0A2T0QDR3_9ACTN|nr:transglycosylase domain-containing protein [Allonocardiopsis opalescens]PRY02086.1 membrane peptidoglycan carboxypeptidase [Allonocardiopsis opalescens]
MSANENSAGPDPRDGAAGRGEPSADGSGRDLGWFSRPAKSDGGAPDAGGLTPEPEPAAGREPDDADERGPATPFGAPGAAGGPADRGSAEDGAEGAPPRWDPSAGSGDGWSASTPFGGSGAPADGGADPDPRASGSDDAAADSGGTPAAPEEDGGEAGLALGDFDARADGAAGNGAGPAPGTANGSHGHGPDAGEPAADPSAGWSVPADDDDADLVAEHFDPRSDAEPLDDGADWSGSGTPWGGADQADDSGARSDAGPFEHGEDPGADRSGADPSPIPLEVSDGDDAAARPDAAWDAPAPPAASDGLADAGADPVVGTGSVWASPAPLEASDDDGAEARPSPAWEAPAPSAAATAAENADADTTDAERPGSAWASSAPMDGSDDGDADIRPGSAWDASAPSNAGEPAGYGAFGGPEADEPAAEWGASKPFRIPGDLEPEPDDADEPGAAAAGQGYGAFGSGADEPDADDFGTRTRARTPFGPAGVEGYTAGAVDDGDRTAGTPDGDTSGTDAGDRAETPVAAAAAAAAGGEPPVTPRSPDDPRLSDTGPNRPMRPGGGPPEPPGDDADAASGGGGDRPRRPRRHRPLAARIGIWAASLVGAVMVAGLAAFGVAYAAIDVPDAVQPSAEYEGSVFYYRDGETVLARQGIDRRPVSLDEVPEHVRNAVLSAENRDFYSEPGVSVTGTMRALWSTVTGEQVQGGSTITQQMVRNYYEGLSQEQTVQRKLAEIVIAIKVDQERTKDWILERYLNTIYFGRGAYGIEAAAHAYFGKGVGELTPDESAFLAAAIQQPTAFGEADESHLPAEEARWRYVVDGLVTMGSVTQAEAAAMEFPLPQEQEPLVDLGGQTGYMWQQALSELEQRGYTEDDINRGGYEIVTTFDQDMMASAEEAVREVLPEGTSEEVLVGVASVEPGTGEVWAFYGGRDYEQDQFDTAFRGSAQVGSSFKPYVLAEALEQGFSLNSFMNASSPQVFNGSPVENYGGTSYGNVSLLQGTVNSVNTGYIQLAVEAGLADVVEMAERAGIPAQRLEPHAEAPTLALGVASMTPVEQAGGFATFASGGVQYDPHVIRSITDRSGQTEEIRVEGERAMDEGVAADTTYALTQVVQRGTGTGAALPDGRPVAGKTGTTDSSAAVWFVGYTPQLSTAVAIYQRDNQEITGIPGYYSLTGGTLPADVFRTYMTAAMDGQEVESFPEPVWGGGDRSLAPAPAPTTQAPAPDDGTVPEPDPGTTDPGPVEPEPEPSIPTEPDPGSPTTEPGPDPEPTGEPPIWPPDDGARREDQ